ncbi:MAG TPA: hypothetical protein VFC18_23395 [Burkholderiales bacterium]|nr:hypothetical protein [Burkholderiales bacterium]
MGTVALAGQAGARSSPIGRLVILLLGLIPALSLANPQEEINRALIERDQRTAEFAAGVNGNVDRRALEILHERQLFEARPLQPYHREQMAREREGFVLQFPPPRGVNKPPAAQKPLPLPGGPRHGVDPVPAQRVDG